MTTARTAYAATFSTGLEVTRNSHRPYTHAYMVVSHTGHIDTGFAASAKLAETAARAVVNQWTGRADYEKCAVRRRPTRHAPTMGWLKWAAQMVASKGGKEAWAAEVAAREAATKVEVVAVR